MKNNTFRFITFLSFMFFTLFLSAQSDEDTGTYTTCNDEGQNATRTSSDLPNPVNVGTIDDRSCYADYKESTINGQNWGIYNITTNSNHLDTNGLQPRIERSLSRSNTTTIGSYARFTGTVRILETGNTSGTSNDGTYIMQAKGKHTGGGGSADPAICLYLAKPVFETDADGKLVQVSFNVYREQINVRGGSGGTERTEVFLTNIKKNIPTDIKLEVGFREDPNDSSKKIHYADAVIGSEIFNWNIPEPERATESGIRYGAYRVKGGRAQIRWANTTYNKEEVVEIDTPGSSGDVYMLKNVATGKFLTDSGVSASPVTMSDSGEEQNKHWTLVENGNFINIDSETYGILRAPGANFSAGAYRVVSTVKASPASDADKVWTIHHNESDDTYRFESSTSNRFLYHEDNGNVTHIPAEETDNRSKWEAILVSEPLSINDNDLSVSSIEVYPNPADNIFTIALHNIASADVIIYNLLGKVIFQDSITHGKIRIENNGKLVSGLYLIKVVTDNNKIYHTKLVIK